MNRQPRTVQALLDGGASISTQGSWHGTAFDWAVRMRDAETMARFAEHAVLVARLHVSLAAYDVSKGENGSQSGNMAPLEGDVRLSRTTDDHDTCTLLGALITHAQSTPLDVLDLRIAELRLGVGCAMHARLGASALCRATLGSLAPDLQESFGAGLTKKLMRLVAQREVVAHWRAEPARARRAAELARTAQRLASQATSAM